MSDQALNTIALMEQLRRKGVWLWAEEGRLRYTAPRGVLLPVEIEALRRQKQPIVCLLDGGLGAPSFTPDTSSSRYTNSAPLSFSQLAHWYLYHLYERPAIRQIASATRILGSLSVSALRESVASLVDRHDALRTGVTRMNCTPVQFIHAADRIEINEVDLTSVPQRARHSEAVRMLQEFLMQPVNIERMSLLGLCLLRLQEQEFLLVNAMEHLISDAFSMQIFMRDLFLTYAQLSAGKVPSFPPVNLRFTDYATHQRRQLPCWIERHGSYWTQHIITRSRTSFPPDTRGNFAAGAGWGTAPLHISRESRASLQDWCRRIRTTLPIAAFTAYVALVHRWCSVSDVIVGYVVDGRDEPITTNCIGYFASTLYVRVQLGAEDTFLDLIKNVTDAYCRAHEHADWSYVEAQFPRPDFSNTTAFNWVPEGADTDVGDHLEVHGAPLTWRPFQFEHPLVKSLRRDSEPFILLYDSPAQIHGGVWYARDRFSSEYMTRFGRNFIAFLDVMSRAPTTLLANMALI